MSITDHMAGMATEKEHTRPMEHEGRGGGEPQGGVHGHLQALHKEMGGTHMHIHKGEDGIHTTHHVGEDGQVQGPHEHENTEALKAHVHQVFSEGHEDGGSWGGKEYAKEGKSGGHESLYG